MTPAPRASRAYVARMPRNEPLPDTQDLLHLLGGLARVHAQAASVAEAHRRLAAQGGMSAEAEEVVRGYALVSSHLVLMAGAVLVQVEKMVEARAVRAPPENGPA